MALLIESHSCDNCGKKEKTKKSYLIEDENKIIIEARKKGWGYTHYDEFVCPKCMKDKSLLITKRAEWFALDM